MDREAWRAAVRGVTKSWTLAVFEATYSYVTDTPDFWRRSHETYPSHGDRFTGEPAYFKHVVSAGQAMLEALGAQPGDFRYAVFHQPNVKFPERAAKMLGFTPEQYETGLLAGKVGNVYAGSSLLGLSAILDEAAPGDRIFFVSGTHRRPTAPGLGGKG